MIPMWFETLMGFREESPGQVRDNIVRDGTCIQSRINGKTYDAGILEIPTLAELRTSVSMQRGSNRALSVREQVADVQQLHADPANEGALFQVASQFNLLEMVSPNVTPEQGVGIYERDRTQGPACAIAAGAGTIYRNYLAPVNGRLGQTADNQIDCLADLGNALGNTAGQYWEMKNGYALASQHGLMQVKQRLDTADEAALEQLRAQLQVGLQWQTQVTLGDCRHKVSQAYCSALPVAYSPHSPTLWTAFARLVLDAAYEATLCAGVLNYQKTGSNKVYLTLLGGGAFGNRKEWILEAIERALRVYEHSGLDVMIVSYGRSDPGINNLEVTARERTAGSRL